MTHFPIPQVAGGGDWFLEAERDLHKALDDPVERRSLIAIPKVLTLSRLPSTQCSEVLCCLRNSP